VIAPLQKEKHGLDISMCTSQGAIIFSFFMPRSKLEERLDREYHHPSQFWSFIKVGSRKFTTRDRLSSLVVSISGKALPSNKKRLLLDVCCSHIAEGNDVDVPYIAYLLPHMRD